MDEQDFESVTSTNSITPAKLTPTIIQEATGKFKCCFCAAGFVLRKIFFLHPEAANEGARPLFPVSGKAADGFTAGKMNRP